MARRGSVEKVRRRVKIASDPGQHNVQSAGGGPRTAAASRAPGFAGQRAPS